jgi:hypothetical protein
MPVHHTGKGSATPDVCQDLWYNPKVGRHDRAQICDACVMQVQDDMLASVVIVDVGIVTDNKLH